MTTRISADTQHLRDVIGLMERPGPVASLYLSLDDRPDSRRISERWTSMRHGAARAGVPGGDLAVLEAEVTHALQHAGPRGLAAFASGGEVRLSERLEGWHGHDDLRWAPLASVVPLLEWLQHRLVCVVVVTDHTGADIMVRTWPDAVRVTQHVEGSDDEIRPVQSGGWAALAMSRFRRRVVDSWQHNARQVAQEVADDCEVWGADALVLSGDLRSVQLLHSQLRVPAGCEVAIHPSGSRGSGGPAPDLWEVVDEVARARCRTFDEAVMREWEQRVGRGLMATSGERDTDRALAEASVQTLLVDREAGPRHDALVREALRTGAAVRVIADMPLADGVGALLRHS